MAAKKTEQIIEIKPIDIVTTNIRIVGDSPLITHAWSQKAITIIRDKQTKKTKNKAREAKNPIEDFVESMYWLGGKPDEMTEEAVNAAFASGRARFGFPVTAIKQATISAAYRSGISKDMASLRGAFFIRGAGPNMLGEVKGSTPVMREDMVRIAMGSADIRYRGMFMDWFMDLEICYNANGVYTLDQIVNLFNLGGFACGIGEWRPEKDGNYGTYRVEGVK